MIVYCVFTEVSKCLILLDNNLVITIDKGFYERSYFLGMVIDAFQRCQYPNYVPEQVLTIGLSSSVPVPSPDILLAVCFGPPGCPGPAQQQVLMMKRSVASGSTAGITATELLVKYVVSVF